MYLFSRLNTQIDLLNSLEIGLITLIIIFLAILEKGESCTLAEKIHSKSWRNVFTTDALINLRSLMELTLLNIGMEYHILITATFFTILVLISIATTVITSTIYYFLNPKSRNF